MKALPVSLLLLLVGSVSCAQRDQAAEPTVRPSATPSSAEKAVPPSPYKNPPGAVMAEYGRPVPLDAPEVASRCIVDSLEPANVLKGSLAGRTVRRIKFVCEPDAAFGAPGTIKSYRYAALDILVPLPYELRECDIVRLRIGRSTTDTWELLEAEVLEGVGLSDLQIDYTRFSDLQPCPRWIPTAQRR